MKTKKIIATIVALASFATMATSSLAATVNTTTTYNTGSGKVSVKVDITDAVAGSEVTYLVKGNDTVPLDQKIVYIDQVPATNGTASFTYKVDKSYLNAYALDVQMGSDKENTFGDGKNVAFTQATSAAVDGATVKFYADADAQNEIDAIGDKNLAGTEDEVIYAKVTYDEDVYTLDALNDKNGTSIAASGDVYPVKKDMLPVQASLTKKATTPDVVGEIVTEGLVTEADKDKIKDPNIEELEARAAVIKVIGSPAEVGVEYNGNLYPAIKNGDSYSNEGLYAVKIVRGKDEAKSFELRRYYKMTADSEPVYIDAK